jgi:hypothetical protein
MTCPLCHGHSTTTAIACGPGVSKILKLACTVCASTGQVTEEIATTYADREAQRRALQQLRVSRRINLAEAAAEIGISPADLSAYERWQKPMTGEMWGRLMASSAYQGYERLVPA